MSAYGNANNAENVEENQQYAYGGRLFDDGGLKTRYTSDGRELTKAVVPTTGEVRWVDLNDSKDYGNGVMGYRYYDEEGNQMPMYTQFRYPETLLRPEFAQMEEIKKQLPENYTTEDVDLLVRKYGYDPDLGREMPGVIKGVTDNPIFKDLYHSVVREPIPFSEKQAAAQRMEDFIHSADYIQKQKYAGLTDTEIKDFQDMVSRRLNGGDFPAYYSRISNDGKSLVLPIPNGGIYMKRGLPAEDFLRAFDHEVGHYSTANIGKTGNVSNELLGWVNKENPTIVEKMLDYNSGIVPFRPKADALKVRKDRGLKTNADWLDRPKNQRLLNYFQDDQEVRSNAYAILQDAERRGMSIDEYVDFCTSPGGEIYGASPKPIKYLNYAFTPDNMKKFLKGFLSISTPVTFTTNIDSQ